MSNNNYNYHHHQQQQIPYRSPFRSTLSPPSRSSPSFSWFRSKQPNRSLLYISVCCLFVYFLLWWTLCRLIISYDNDFRSIILEDGFPHDQTSFSTVQSITRSLQSLSVKHPTLTLIIYSFAYLERDTLPVSGKFYMNMIGSQLYGPILGTLLCVTLTLTGSLLIYFAVQTLITIVEEQFNFRYHQLNDSLSISISSLSPDERCQLFYILLLLRILSFTMIPTWIQNVIYALIGIPWWEFALSVTFGTLPVTLCGTLWIGQIMLDLVDFFTYIRAVVYRILVTFAVIAIVAVFVLLYRMTLACRQIALVR